MEQSEKTASKGPLPAGRREKATGWRLPLLFSGVIILLALFINSILPKPYQPLPLPLNLEKEAQAIQIELNTAEGKKWREEISSAASGLEGHSVKDGKLLSILVQALDQRRFDAACTALALIRDESRRQEAANLICARALANCTDLPWTAFAWKVLKKSEDLETIRQEISQKWEQCQTGAALK